MRFLSDLKFIGSRERAIMMDVTYPETGSKKPLVIFCHGFKGFKDWGHFNLISQSLAKAGFVVAKFNFSYNGGNENQVIDFPDLEAFGQNNMSTELNDLGIVIDNWQISGNFIADSEVDRTHLIIIGHSRGGGICILKAAEDKRVKKIISLAGIGSVGRLFQSDTLMKKWKEEGLIYIPNDRTHQQMPMYYQYYEDYIANMERLDISKAAEKINVPWLIIHGSSDLTVGVSTAESLHQKNSQSKLLIINGADHTFGGKHPWDSFELPEATLVLVEKVIQFIKAN